jgi:serine/threonine protein kinase
MSLQATKTGPDAQAAKILENRVPDRIGKYVIINEVGRGSTGTVYLSHDSYYGRDVAIKVNNQDHDPSDERAKIARKMFLSEAHMVGMLQHPHILPIYDAGEENGRCYIVTEHVHGARTLSSYCLQHYF